MPVEYAYVSTVTGETEGGAGTPEQEENDAG